MTILEQSFIHISCELGKDHMLVQSAGGNTSFKKDEKMWIKASGKWLSNAKKEDIFNPDYKLPMKYIGQLQNEDDIL